MALTEDLPPIVTVTGTNGKGSTVCALKALSLAAGLNVGVYTSPHILSVRERIAINHSFISDEDFIAALQSVEQARHGVLLTFFEFLTLAAMSYFKTKSLDMLILEVGLGGRLDAVNIFDSRCAVVTGIGADHMDYLGDTLEDIAREKAGIFRENIPVVYGIPTLYQSLSDHALSLYCPFYQIGQAFKVAIQDKTWSYQGIEIELKDLAIGSLLPQNIAIALCVMEVLSLVKRSELSRFKKAVESMSLLGRGTKIVDCPPTWVDVAHNAQALQTGVSWLLKHQACSKFHLVFAMQSTKDLLSAVAAIKSSVLHWHIILFDNNQMANELCYRQAFLQCDVEEFSFYSSVRMLKSTHHFNKDDRILVTGSHLLVEAYMKNV
jgi:dihydrofolate synthase/folylpolyglutamate synthase